MHRTYSTQRMQGDMRGLGKIRTGMGIFRVKAGRVRRSRFLGKGAETGFLSKGGMRLYGF